MHYDSKSLDHSRITDNIVKGKKDNTDTDQDTADIGALIDGTIDAGVWNYDDVLENHHDRLKGGSWLNRTIIILFDCCGDKIR